MESARKERKKVEIERGEATLLMKHKLNDGGEETSDDSQEDTTSTEACDTCGSMRGSRVELTVYGA